VRSGRPITFTPHFAIYFFGFQRDSLKFEKRCQFFVGPDDESFSVAARCVSATKIVRPSESTVETQPQLQPSLLRLSAIVPQYLICADSDLAMIRGSKQITCP
jgi:hypothetical protein